MEIIRFFKKVRVEFCSLNFPIDKTYKTTIEDRSMCEAALDNLCCFWWEVSNQFYWHDIIKYQISVLKFQVRLQKSSHIRMIHQQSKDGRLLLDVPVLLNYRFSPESYDYLKEREIVKECFRKVPEDFYKRRDMEIIPVIIYDNNKVLVDRNKLSSIEAVPEGLIEINEQLQ